MALDIILLALVSYLIIRKLFSQFGKVDESDKERNEIINMFKQNGCKSCQIVGNSKEEATKNVVDVIKYDIDEKEVKKSSLDKKLDEIFQNISFMDKENFLKGAEDCFELIINSFANKNPEIFDKLVSETISNKMKKEIADLDHKKEKYNITIVSIPKKEIISAKIVDNNAFIDVVFTSEQIVYKEDKNAKIIEGSKENIQKISEIWTFRKDLTSEDPNWIVIETKVQK